MSATSTTSPTASVAAGLRSPATARQALVAGLLIFAGTLSITVVGGLLTRAVMPGASGMVRALVVLVVMTGAAVAVRSWFGSWRSLGVNGPHLWSRPGLLSVPLLLALSPLVVGLQQLTASIWLLLVVGYALTGFTEELLWRGIAQRLLAPLGPARGVLVGSALFGLAHLGNVLYRDSVTLVLAQAWGAFCFGVGYAALRRRTNTIVPLMALHLLTDLCAAAAAGPAIPFLVGQDIVLLTFGSVLLLRDSRAARGRRLGEPGGPLTQAREAPSDDLTRRPERGPGLGPDVRRRA